MKDRMFPLTFCRATTKLAGVLALVGACAGCASMDGGGRTEALMRERAERADARRSAHAADAGSAKTDADTLPVLSGSLSLADAITLALANNRSLKTAYLTRVEADGLVTEAFAGALPQVGANASAAAVGQQDDSADVYSLGVEVSQPLWRSGAVAAGVRYAQLYAASTDFTICEKVQATVADVTTKYLDVLLRRHLVRVFEEAAAVSDRVLETAKSRRAQGVVSDYEVLRAEVEVANTRAELINERNALQCTIVTLFQTLGVSQKSRVDFVGDLVFAPEAHDVDAASAKAFALRPDLARGLAALRMAEENVRIVASSYGPAADLFASADYSNRINDEWDDEWTAGARATWKLFDGFERRGRMQAARSRRDQAAETLRDLEDRAHVEVVNALLQLKYADELYQSQIKNIDLAREALRIIGTGFALGRNTQVEVLDARAALTKATGMYYKAVHAHGLARLGVLRATGALDASVAESGLVGEAPPVLPTPPADVEAGAEDPETAPAD
ncbi:MAG: TolC family protein [Kiritimatiellia bacterium]|jgi:outer membrane protein